MQDDIRSILHGIGAFSGSCASLETAATHVLPNKKVLVNGITDGFYISRPLNLFDTEGTAKVHSLGVMKQWWFFSYNIDVQRS